MSSSTRGKVSCAVWREGGASASRGHPAAVLTPARDFWMFSLALAMSRRITLAPFSCRQVQKEPVFSFIKKNLISKNKKEPSCGESGVQSGSSAGQRGARGAGVLRP